MVAHRTVAARAGAEAGFEGGPRVPDRQALRGIPFVLHTGTQWEYLPQELGFGSGMTCWRRLAWGLRIERVEIKDIALPESSRRPSS